MDDVTDKSRPRREENQSLRSISGLLFAAALVGIAAMLITDVLRHHAFVPAHQRIAAFPLMLVGLSCISLNASARRTVREHLQGILLGLAFVLWGGEQLMPPTPLVTIMDEAVVTIFVVDLGVIIVTELRRNERTFSDSSGEP